MNTKIDEELLDNNNTAESFISLFFLGLDAVAYIIIFTLFNCEFKNLRNPKQKLYFYIILDGFSRLVKIYTKEYKRSFVQEATFDLIATIQFYLSLDMLNQVFTDQKNDDFMRNELQIKNKGLFSILFFCFVFSFKGILSSYKLLCTIQLICIFISTPIFYKFLSNKIDIFLTNIQRNNSQFVNKNFINNFPFFILIYLGINYTIELFGLMIDNELYESYVSMICIIFKEVGKVLLFLLLIFIYNTFNKYVKTGGTEYTPHINPINEKKPVQVFKDEDETAQF
jgi:hypothetical protein